MLANLRRAWCRLWHNHFGQPIYSKCRCMKCLLVWKVNI